ncbi:hypothetical protein [Alienimonas chondri]|uniref:Apea-like HEPN domain-containing protein n=1 Tax=Alienimonas chondri TaxID=2681879 RepID=A0ABX1VH53_9PLAN|nr:hypothetical protein [Alienimonas chondri]NNJ27195.1 hypothetical protein [Alienimonas chondri]
MSNGFLSNSWTFIDVADEAAVRSVTECGHTESTRSHDPIVAVVFAAAATEAFMCELAAFAKSNLRCNATLSPQESTIQQFRDIYNELESSKGSLIAKYSLALGLFTGQPTQKGKSPFQDFALLLDLRNSLIHSKLSRIEIDEARTATMQFPKIINKLAGNGILAPIPPKNTLTSWVQLVSTPAVAVWAVRSAGEIIRHVITSIPKSLIGDALSFHYMHKLNSLKAAE